MSLIRALVTAQRAGGIAVCVLAAASCGRGPEVRQVTTPSGRPGFALACKRAIDCMDLAGKACPGGYVTVDRASETEGRAFATANQGSAVGWAKVESTGTMLIECRDDPWANCNADRERWDRCVAAGGRCTEQRDGSASCVRKEKAPRCGYTCAPQPRTCPWLDENGCYKPGYEVPEK